MLILQAASVAILYDTHARTRHGGCGWGGRNRACRCSDFTSLVFVLECGPPSARARHCELPLAQSMNILFLSSALIFSASSFNSGCSL